MTNKKYKIKLPPDRKNLPIPDHEESIAELVAEGNRLLEAEPASSVKSTKPNPPKPVEDPKLQLKLGLKSSNVYIRARCELLSQMDDAKRITLEKMEANLIERDRRFDEFVKDIIRLGDKLSN